MSDGDRPGAEGGARRALPEFRPGDIPIVSDVHATWTRLNDPAAKLERRKRRTARAVTLWILLTMISVFYAATGYFGLVGGVEGLEGALSGIIGMFVFGTLGVRSGTRLRALNRTEVPASRTPARLPPSGSAAREPMRQLAKCESNLTELLGQLGEHGIEARTAADEASTALRNLAARVQSIERARGNSPSAEEGALDSAVASLAEQLDDGVDGYRELVAAAGRAVAASSGGSDGTRESLTEATDHLAGLAIALRELS